MRNLQLILTNEQAEWEIYKTCNALGKLAIPLGGGLPEKVQLAFEGMLADDLLKFVDVAPLLAPVGPNGTPVMTMCRLFMLTEAGKKRKAVVKIVVGGE